MTAQPGDNPLAASDTPEIDVVTLTNADQEYSQALPDRVRKYSIRVRTGGSVKLAFTSGESGTTYITVDSGGYTEDLIGSQDLVLYMQSPIAGTVVEIVSWS